MFPIILLPLPMTGEDFEVDCSPLSHSSSRNFIYLGYGTIAKGFDILVHALSQLAMPSSPDGLQVTLQCNTNVAGLEEELTFLERDLGSRLNIIRGPITRERYYGLLQSADCVIIPHRSLFYGYALSGVFTEAMSYGKPVIASNQTYMMSVAAEMGCGISFEDGSWDSLASSILLAATKLSELQLAARKSRVFWREKNNPKEFVRQLLSAY